ncbi:hypothetical protein SAMN05518865_10752 [Duganella sp. CF458]|uniref:hypothetical protein n=1 Tax=Duganella sp. CF458 TaxID=1884368 RepID=UPI0008EDD6F3|nr:hypothetical protein [Duganella sp. CF458]SFG00065.1 hypothetical protein SAMN05518865_10752 [Duganella sp. CF458]
MALSFKKAIALAIFGIGVGASATALAIPDYNTCYSYREACALYGDEEACATFDLMGCSRYHYPF